jgi:hypothetical protein
MNSFIKNFSDVIHCGDGYFFYLLGEENSKITYSYFENTNAHHISFELDGRFSSIISDDPTKYF